MSISNKLAQAVVERLLRQRYSEEFCDVVIRVEKTEFRCHKFILSACSKYFKELFEEHTVDGQDLEFTSAETFNNVLSCIYGGIDILKESNLDKIWEATKWLKIDFLYEACEAFQSERVDKENCVEMINQAKEMESEKLRDESLRVIVTEFQDVSKMDNFVSLKPDDFLDVLNDRDLNVGCEDQVLSAILKWMQLSPEPTETKSRVIVDLLKASRLCLASGRALQNLMDVNAIAKNRKAFNIIREALRYHQHPDRRSYYCPAQAVHRSSSDYQNVVVSVSRDPKGSFVMSCRDIYEDWYMLDTPPQAESFTSHGKYIFASGQSQPSGSDIKVSFHRYNTQTGKWSQLPPLKTSASRYSLICLDNFLYAVGIADSTTICRMDISESTEWSKIGELLVPVNNMVLTTCENSLIILGNEKNSKEITLQSFDSVSLTSHVYADKLSANATSLTTFDTGRKTYVLLSNGEVWKVIACDSKGVQMYQKGKLFEDVITLHSAVTFQDTVIIAASNVLNPQMKKRFETQILDQVKSVEIIQRPSRCLINAAIPRNLLSRPEP
ncbi:kelch-like protein 24 [Biomphalaria glabrata]|uniref:Kelch-like protein 24 n=1 Tax=Biomphalaria glabrata TaxID=6526 RepID=A0A9U8EHM0_BIOGL|nr:kelch-like protein 24 [Biomphalaria glabrata]